MREFNGPMTKKNFNLINKSKTVTFSQLVAQIGFPPD